MIVFCWESLAAVSSPAGLFIITCLSSRASITLPSSVMTAPGGAYCELSVAVCPLISTRPSFTMLFAWLRVAKDNMDIRRSIRVLSAMLLICDGKACRQCGLAVGNEWYIRNQQGGRAQVKRVLGELQFGDCF